MPHVWDGALGPEDRCLIMACDGLWDVVSEQVRPARQRCNRNAAKTKLVQQERNRNTTMVQQGCNRNETMVQQDCNRNTTMVQQGCNRNATIVQQGCNRNATMVQQGYNSPRRSDWIACP